MRGACWWPLTPSGIHWPCWDVHTDPEGNARTQSTTRSLCGSAWISDMTHVRQHTWNRCCLRLLQTKLPLSVLNRCPLRSCFLTFVCVCSCESLNKPPVQQLTIWLISQFPCIYWISTCVTMFTACLFTYTTVLSSISLLTVKSRTQAETTIYFPKPRLTLAEDAGRTGIQTKWMRLPHLTHQSGPHAVHSNKRCHRDWPLLVNKVTGICWVKVTWNQRLWFWGCETKQVIRALLLLLMGCRDASVFHSWHCIFHMCKNQLHTLLHIKKQL